MTECPVPPRPSWFHDKKHPLWPIIKMGAAVIAVNVTVLTLILAKNATKFDADEIKNIGAFAGVISVIGGLVLSAYKGIMDRRGDRNGDNGTES